MINKKVIYIFLLLPLLMFSQQEHVTFEKSQKKYKNKRILYGTDFSTDYNFHLFYEKRAILKNGIELHRILFGPKEAESYGVYIEHDFFEWGKKYDYISFSGDSIFYYNGPFSGKNIYKKLLFVLDENYRDTVFIENFGDIYLQEAKFNYQYYYTPIQDTVYEYKLWLKSYPRLVSDLTNALRFTSIGISKKYGFIWIEYRTNIKYYKIWFY